MHSLHTGVDFPLRDVPGYSTVADLIPEGHLIGFTVVWALRLEHFVDSDFVLHRRLVLELGESRELDSSPLIRLTMLRPRQFSFSDDYWQIMGLAIEDLRNCGMEDIRFRVYDYEMTDFNVTCAALELSRAEKPDYP